MKKDQSEGTGGCVRLAVGSTGSPQQSFLLPQSALFLMPALRCFLLFLLSRRLHQQRVRACGHHSATSAVDSGRSADTTYLYKVHALGNGGSSGFSPVDAATTTVFSDASLAGALIKAVHITQLRTAVNAMRAAAVLPPMMFTDSSLMGVVIKRVHISELRTSLDAVRSTIGLSAIGYTDPMLSVGSRG